MIDIFLHISVEVSQSHGYGRREFLKLFGTTLAALASTASPAAVLMDGYFVNRKLGVAFKNFWAGISRM